MRSEEGRGSQQRSTTAVCYQSVPTIISQNVPCSELLAVGSVQTQVPGLKRCLVSITNGWSTHELDRTPRGCHTLETLAAEADVERSPWCQIPLLLCSYSLCTAGTVMQYKISAYRPANTSRRMLAFLSSR